MPPARYRRSGSSRRRRRSANGEALPAHVRLPDERVRLGEDRRRAARGRGPRARRAAGRRRRDRVQYLLGARKSAGKAVRRPRPGEASEARKTGPDDRGRRLRRKPGRAGNRRARAVRGRGVRAADPAPAARAAHLPPARVAGAAAFVSIMEGCSKYCSFCVVPYTRGEEVSRPFDDVIAEIDGLAAQGVKEVTLLGQNVNAWRGTIDGAQSDFAELLYYLCELPLERIRYTTSHPRDFTQRLIDAHAELPRLAPHVHLPVQSGSDRVLAAMKRGYTALEYRSIARRLKQARAGISLSSDFIVGFPGETDADFEATLKLAGDIGFDASF